ncbi:MAG: hypothetical protein ABW034_15905, partial [Steroidobacteraceae bacterium]
MDTLLHSHTGSVQGHAWIRPLALSLALLAGVQITSAQDCNSTEAECAAPEFASPTRRDRAGRIAVPVWVDGKGP